VGDQGQVAILCGGRGARLRELTHAIPKALVEIGGMPILWHVVRIYAAQGFHRFLLLTGERGELIAEFVAAAEWPEGLEIECLDTGIDTPTGGRVARAADRLREGTFCLTYADGVADLDLAALLAFHRRQRALVTMTVVQPHSPWGIATLGDHELVTGFSEKPRLEHWINGGFFCVDPAFLDYVEESSVLEREPLERLAAAGGLTAFRHHGFWDCMDTYKDAILLNDLWASGQAPWRVWEDDGGAPPVRPRSPDAHPQVADAESERPAATGPVPGSAP
jgi:glucose-1-phosphate cytidylyltransferase